MPIPNYLYGKKLTDEQKEVMAATATHKVIFINADAGTGKTWLVTAIAKQLGKKMHYIFAPVLQDTLGLLPGTQEEKEAPFLHPLMDALEGIKEKPEEVIFSKIEFRPHAWVFPSSHTYWRGRNLEDSVVVIDEAQNFTKHELRKILTRCHDSCLVFVLGHVGQIDLKNPDKSGLAPYLVHTETTDIAIICHLTKNFRGKISNWADKI
jgi:phosphate starvation-inducible protein PhoH